MYLYVYIVSEVPGDRSNVNKDKGARTICALPVGVLGSYSRAGESIRRIFLTRLKYCDLSHAVHVYLY